MNRSLRRSDLAATVAALAILLSLAVVPALAVDWDGEVKLSSTETADHELVRTGPQQALMIWRRGTALLARRTTDGGRTWLPVRTLATSVGLGASAAAVDGRVDVVYAREVTCAATGAPASRIYYRRSTDGGDTWTAPAALTSSCSETYQPDVARAADGQVSVTWAGTYTGRILVRTSRNGGVTFGAAVQAASTSNWGGDSCGTCRPISLADPEIAIGSSGSTYLAYTSAADTLSIRRSTTRGATWWAPRVLSTEATSERLSLLADGARAIVGYTTTTSSMRAVYRTTTDRGVTWSTGRAVITVGSGGFSAEPEFAYQAGVLAVIVKQGRPGASPVWHRQSTNWGGAWTAPTRVSIAHPGGRADPEPAGVAILDGTHLAGYAENGDVTGLWVRRGAP